MRCTTYFKYSSMHVAPVFKTLQFICAGHREFFRKFHFLGLFIDFVQSFRDYGSCMENSCELSSQQVSLKSRKTRVAVKGSIQVTC